MLGPVGQTILIHILDPAAAASTHYQKYIGPTLHVGPNKYIRKFATAYCSSFTEVSNFIPVLPGDKRSPPPP